MVRVRSGISILLLCAIAQLSAATAPRLKLAAPLKVLSPVNGATDVSTLPTLSWSSRLAASYDVYLGTAAPLPRVATQSATASYTPAAPLAAGTTYYWRIVAYNSDGSTTAAQWSFTTTAAPPAPPDVASSPTAPTAGQTWNVAADGDLQATLNAAQPGDTILLEAGATFSGNFVLPAKTGDSTSYITIRSSATLSTLPAPGVRIDPTYAPQLPKLRSPNSMPALVTAAYAHHYRIELVEFVGSPLGYYDILALGDGSSTQNTLDMVPHDLIVDRVYMHGDPAVGQKRGIALNSASTTIQNSYIADIKSADQDAQAICGWNGPGPYTITNNYLEASGENVLFGGADPAIVNLVPSDIIFTRNYLSKPLAWRWQPWIVKNLFELKNAQRVTIDGNVMENNWASAQSGYAILLTPRNGGTAPWSVVQQVSFTNNVVRHVSSAFNVLGSDDGYTTLTTNDVVIRNNLFEDVSAAAYGGEGRLLMINGGVQITVDHNTVLNDGLATVCPYGTAVQGFVFTNNFIPDNGYGIIGDNAPPGTPTITAYFPNVVFLGNIIVGAPASDFPAGNFYPATTTDGGLVSYGSGDYTLLANSTYSAAATDGTAIGANIDAINAAAGTNY